MALTHAPHPRPFERETPYASQATDGVIGAMGNITNPYNHPSPYGSSHYGNNFSGVNISQVNDNTLF